MKEGQEDRNDGGGEGGIAAGCKTELETINLTDSARWRTKISIWVSLCALIEPSDMASPQLIFTQSKSDRRGGLALLNRVQILIKFHLKLYSRLTI